MTTKLLTDLFDDLKRLEHRVEAETRKIKPGTEGDYVFSTQLLIMDEGPNRAAIQPQVAPSEFDYQASHGELLLLWRLGILI